MIVLWVGLELTLYGMGLVFLLLAILWGLIALLTRLDNAPAADAPVVTQTASDEVGVRVVASSLEPNLLAAIFIACRAHRMARRKQAAPEMRTHEPGSLPSRWVGSGRTRQNRSWAPRGRYS